MATNTKPTTTTIDWKALVIAADPEREKPEIAYEFSDKRKFERKKNPYAA